MIKKLLPTVPIAAIFYFGQAAEGVTLLNDTFADGGRTNGADLQDSAWYVGGSGTGRGADASSGALVVSSGNNTVVVTTSFGGATLAVGESISLSFSFSGNFNNSVANAFRFGLFDSFGSQLSADTTGGNGAASATNTWRGYSMWTPYGAVSSSSASLYKRVDNSTTLYASAVNDAVGSAFTYANNLSNGNSYTGSLLVTRVGDELQITASLGGVTTSYTDNSTTPSYTFDSIQFFAGSSAIGNGSFTIDNVLVTYSPVPEPSTSLLAVFRRRR